MASENLLKLDFNKVVGNSVGDKIYCHCDFEFKDEIKKHGFKWCPKYKLWCVNKESLTFNIYKLTQKVRFTDFTTIGAVNYYYVYYQTRQDMMNKVKELKNNDVIEVKTRKVMKKLF